MYRSLSAYMVAACLVACGGGDSTSGPPAQTPVASVSVFVANAALTVGGTTVASATTRDAAGLVLTGRAIAWQSSAPGVASIDGAGAVVALSPGSVVISATSEGRTGTVSLTVAAVPVATVAASVATSALIIGMTTQASAVLRDATGNQLTGRSVSWASDASAIASVSAGGLVTAVGVGTATISATSEGRTGSAVVTVTRAPVANVSVALGVNTILVNSGTVATATLRDAGGSALTDRVVEWSSSASNIAQISQSGQVTGVSAGTATITATSEGRSGSAIITVSQPSVATVLVSPASVSLSTGQTTVTSGNAARRSAERLERPNCCVEHFESGGRDSEHGRHRHGGCTGRYHDHRVFRGALGISNHHRFYGRRCHGHPFFGTDHDGGRRRQGAHRNITRYGGKCAAGAKRRMVFLESLSDQRCSLR